jgi:hypothetical protein
MFNRLIDYLKQPTSRYPLRIYSDGNDDYISVLPEYFHVDSLSYGQKVKHKNGEKLVPALRRKVYGNPCLEDIDTNTNECFNSILRDRLSKLVRKTKCHAKARHELNCALFLFQFHWNFMHKNAENLTPAILEKQATKVWTWGNFLHAKLSYTK